MLLKKLDTVPALEYLALFITFQSVERLDEHLHADPPPPVGVPLLQDLGEGHHCPRLPRVCHPLVDVLAHLLGAPPEHQAPPPALVAPLKVASS